MALCARLSDSHRHCHRERGGDRDYESFHGTLLIRSISIDENTLRPRLPVAMRSVNQGTEIA